MRVKLPSKVNLEKVLQKVKTPKLTPEKKLEIAQKLYEHSNVLKPLLLSIGLGYALPALGEEIKIDKVKVTGIDKINPYKDAHSEEKVTFTRVLPNEEQTIELEIGTPTVTTIPVNYNGTEELTVTLSNDVVTLKYTMDITKTLTVWAQKIKGTVTDISTSIRKELFGQSTKTITEIFNLEGVAYVIKDGTANILLVLKDMGEKAESLIPYLAKAYGSAVNYLLQFVPTIEKWSSSINEFLGINPDSTPVKDSIKISKAWNELINNTKAYVERIKGINGGIEMDKILPKMSFVKADGGIAKRNYIPLVLTEKILEGEHKLDITQGNGGVPPYKNFTGPYGFFYYIKEWLEPSKFNSLKEYIWEVMYRSVRNALTKTGLYNPKHLYAVPNPYEDLNIEDLAKLK
ncbi:NEQ080 [Nanoarchaeum equitans Kin4-M]|uniref:NEQ080 n=1 Tax=Nanoarchaeum equitans (strain Kin4-M) TaxID=228908 RepID=Q74MI8_NANEQ|nr:NEQ080 [Nanoarchaeum equitans Kin4-M]